MSSLPVDRRQRMGKGTSRCRCRTRRLRTNTGQADARPTTTRRRPGFGRWAALLLVAAALLVGCGDDDDGADPEVVTIFAPYQGREADLFTADLEEWAASEGIDIRYTGTGTFVRDLERQVDELADPPDIAVVPQRGVVERLAADGRILAMSDDVAAAAAEAFDPGALRLAEIDGELMGVPIQVNVKSLVWYRPSVLSDLGLEVPATLDELERLVAAIENAGITPWCLAIEAQTATGWPATDWIEDLVVRLRGAEVYEQWVRGEIAFADDEIRSAFDTFADLVLTGRRIAGGTSAALATSTQDGHEPLFADPPGCVLYKQANFALGWMPDGLSFGADGDIDAFVLPGVTADDVPLVVGGDLAVAFDDRAAVDDVLAFLTTPESAQSWVAAGGHVSPRRTAVTDHAQPADRFVAELLLARPTLVYDASDAMPPEIGTDLFWDRITRWISGSVTFDELAETLDEARAAG